MSRFVFPCNPQRFFFSSGKQIIGLRNKIRRKKVYQESDLIPGHLVRRAFNHWNDVTHNILAKGEEQISFLGSMCQCFANLHFSPKEVGKNEDEPQT